MKPLKKKFTKSMIYWKTKIKSNKALSTLLSFITIGFEKLNSFKND
jgi:hypothetical protein